MEQKKPINIEELSNFKVLPYTGHENHAPEHPDIVAFVQLMLSKGYSKEDLLVAWGECMGIKLEAQEQGNSQRFDSSDFDEKFIGELTIVRAFCYLFRHLLTAEMELYYYAWLDTLRNAKLPTD